MIRIFIGNPGGGKTYGGLVDMTEELVYGTRLVITNFPIIRHDYAKYLSEAYPETYPDLNQRLRIITDAEAKEFYRYRGLTGELKNVTREESLSGTHIVFEGRSVAYYIDEAHIMFDAREWSRTGPELTFYTSQHRKLDDECVFVTQHPDQLEKRVRMLAQEFWCFNNFGLEKFMTVFQKPNFFSCEIHRKLPSPNSPPPQAVHRYRLNVKLADCYDTSAGVGISGRKMPEVRKKKGLPIWLVAVPALALGAAMFYIPDLLTRGITSVVDTTQTDIPQAISQTIAPGQTAGNGLAVPTATTAPIKPIYVQSVAIRTGGGAFVTLTDGSILVKANGLARITDEAVYTTDGKRFLRLRGTSGARSAP